MQTITWVGIDHYIEKERLEAFYDEIKEGDIVTLIPEPDNYWDSRAVAVFHKFIMCGHVSRHETAPVHLMCKNNVEMVGRITDDIDCDINQIKIVVDSVASAQTERCDYPKLVPPELGIDMNPHIMYEEYSYCQIKEKVECLQRTIKTNDIDSEIVAAAVKEIVSTMDIYLTIWNHSISRQANELPRYFDEVITNLSNQSRELKSLLRPTLKNLRKCTAQQAKVNRIVAIFLDQLKNLELVYSNESGFYSVFDKMYVGKKEKMKRRIEAISKWLNRLPSNRKCCFNEDFSSFVHNIYCYGYEKADLYCIITHLLAMRRLAVRLYDLPCDISIERLVVNGDINLNKFVCNKVHIDGDVIESGGTKINQMTQNK